MHVDALAVIERNEGMGDRPAIAADHRQLSDERNLEESLNGIRQPAHRRQRSTLDRLGCQAGPAGTLGAPSASRERRFNPMQKWESLGGQVGSRPAVVSWAANEMQVFFIGPDGQLWDTYWDGAAWHERHPHGGDLTGSPAACSWGADRIDVFARGRDGSLQHRWYEPAGWQAWESLGIGIAGDPAACSWGRNRIDLFFRDAAGDLLHGWWDGERWSFAAG
jgi:hypothetical protein